MEITKEVLGYENVRSIYDPTRDPMVNADPTKEYEIEITLKMHGTSQRTAYLPTLVGYKDSYGCKLKNNIRHMLHKILRKKKPFEYIHTGEPIYDWGYVSGTRRTVLENFEGGYYGSNEFREAHSKFFEGKLNKGESVYYEVVGFTTSGTPIMSSCDNKKLNDKEFVKQYGQNTVFSYGCHPDGTKTMFGIDGDGIYAIPVELPQSDIYVYRMTMTNEDGFTVEYTPDFMRYRCEQMGVKCVPTMDKFIIPEDIENIGFETDEGYEYKTAGEYVKDIAEQYYDGPDPIGKTHIREGVVVRIINRPKFAAYKHKNWCFKALEGIVKVEAETPDIEEVESIIEDDAE